MRIGNVELATNLLLSPIAGFCDLPFRRVVRPLGGLGLACTDLVNPRALRAGTARSRELVSTTADDQPLAIQLYGSEADELAEAAVWAADNGATIVDINMGCPVPKVAGKGGGSGLLRCADDAVRLAERVVRATPVPVTVKTRLGWYQGDLMAPDFARRLEQAGVAAITIHGRYGEQKFSGSCDPTGIAAVVAAVKTIPVIGNGDIRSPQDVVRMFDQTGCAGVMIGRRALADPWIFRDSHALLTAGRIPPPPSRLQRAQRMIEHFENMIAFYGPRRAVVGFRKRMVWYSKTLGPCPELRRQIPYVDTVEQWYALVDPFVEQLRHEAEPAELISLDSGNQRATPIKEAV